MMLNCVQSVQNNLKQIGLALDYYADRHDGNYPPLSTREGCLMFEHDLIEASHIDDASIFICPIDTDSDRQRDFKEYVDDFSYYYFSFAVSDEQEAINYVEDYRAGKIGPIKSREPFFGKGPARLGEVSNEDASRIPVLIEKSEHHEPKGGNVLFLDGHVEYIRLDEKFPMTTNILEALNSIDLDHSSSSYKNIKKER